MMATGKQNIPAVLSIAGSDPSGGAGIQADLKTFMAAGVYGAAVITALTAQNTRGVYGAMPIPAEFVEQQIKSVLSDIPLQAVKLGMLPNSEVCLKIAPHLQDYPVVCDPVMVATSGDRLIDEAAIEALINRIFPASDFITPNRAELEIIFGTAPSDAVSAGKQLLERFENLTGIVIKGGHWPDDSDRITDTLVYRHQGNIISVSETHRYVDTSNTHGTGCTFSSALAAFLALGRSPGQAFSEAVHFTASLIEISAERKIGDGHGPLLHHMFRR